MTPENPSAFPLNPTNDGTSGAFCPEPGMTLQDYFAGQALTGIGAAWSREGASPEDLADFSYDVADAMLATRATSKEAQGNG